MKNTILITCAVAILGTAPLFFPGCNGSNTSTANTVSTLPETSSSKKITVAQWGQERYLIYLPLYVAMEEGYFAKRKIDVSLKFSGNDDQTFATVLRGDAQFGIGDPAFTAISEEKGFGGKVVGTLVSGVSIWGVTNNAKVKEIKNPQDLAGLRIGTFPSPSTNYTLIADLIKSHPEIKPAPKIVQAPIGSQLALLESKRADIAMELEPAASLAEAKNYRVVYSSPQFHGPFSFTGITTTTSVIQSDRDMVQSFISAIEEAIKDCQKDHEIAIRTGKKLFPNLAPQVVSNAVNRMISEKTFPTSVVTSDKAWQAALSVRLQVGDLKKAQATSVAVDNTFALKAAQKQ